MALKADYIVRSQRVFTSAPGAASARPLAFAVAADRIAYVDEFDRVQAEAGPGTPVVDLGDALVCPGFHDAHLHFFHTALGSSPYMLMDMGKSEADLVAKTRAFAASLPDDAWVITQGWRDYRWDPPVPPTKRSLDEAFPDRPCAMYSGDGHTMWLNSRALELVGITRDSVPPQGGAYDKDQDGELTGIVREAAAMQLLPRMLEWISPERIERVYADQMARMAQQGITSICDMSLMPLPGLDFIREDIYEALESRDQLTLRAHLFPTLLDDQSRLEAMQKRYRESTLLRAPGFKQFFDGVSSQHTAYLTDPYSNPHFPGDRGRLTVSAEKMRAMVLAAAERGHAVRIHTSAMALSMRRWTSLKRLAAVLARPRRVETHWSIWRTCCPATSTACASWAFSRPRSPATSRWIRVARSAIWARSAAASCGPLLPILRAAWTRRLAPTRPSRP